MSLARYEQLVARLDEQERQHGAGPRKAWPDAAQQRYVADARALLREFPYLEGWWQRLAAAEYAVGRTEAARAELAAATAAAPASPALWVRLCDFLILTNAPAAETRAAFERGAAAVGGHFLSHEFWDLYIAWLLREHADEPAPQRTARVAHLLVHIVRDTTLHQFAKYYEYLVQIARFKQVPLAFWAAEDVGVDAATPEGADAWNAVLKAALQLYTAQQARVARAWRHERQLVRPFFFPVPLPPAQVAAWAAYLDDAPAAAPANDPAQRHALYRRALLADAHNEALWLDYVRTLLADEADPAPAFAAAEAVLPAGRARVRLYWALWLESRGEDAAPVYEKLLAAGGAEDADLAETALAFSAFRLRRARDDAIAPLEAALARPLADDHKLDVVRRLADLRPNAFDAYPLASAAYWRAFLAFAPDRADELYDRAPEGVLDEPYLALLAERNPKKYIEMDRLVHRSALAE